MGRKLNYVLSFRPINTGGSRGCVFWPGAGGEEAAGSLAEGEALDGQADAEVEEQRDAAEAVGVVGGDQVAAAEVDRDRDQPEDDRDRGALAEQAPVVKPDPHRGRAPDRE